MPPFLEISSVTGKAFPSIETFHRARRQADLHGPMNVVIRNTVIMAVHLDVVVNMDSGFFPFRIGVWFAGQWLQRGLVQRFK